MYSKEQASQIRQRFWTSFGQYMRPVAGADGETVNWLNYKTGIRHFYFRMDADKKQARIGIELKHPDPAAQEEYFNQLVPLKKILEEQTGEEWSWQLHQWDEDGKPVSRISTVLSPVNIFNTDDWPAIISFFKQRIMALDAFWQLVKDGFE